MAVTVLQLAHIPDYVVYMRRSRTMHCVDTPLHNHRIAFHSVDMHVDVTTKQSWRRSGWEVSNIWLHRRLP